MFGRIRRYVHSVSTYQFLTRRPAARLVRTAALLGLTLAPLAPPVTQAQDLSKYGASTIKVIAGLPGTNGDFTNGVPATTVGLSLMQSVRTDAAGNIYFIQGTVVRMIYVNGPVPSILQQAVSDYSLLSNASSQPTTATGGQGNVYTLSNANVATSCGNDATCGDGGSAVTAALISPYALALDSSGNLYVADISTFSVRKINAADGKISTIAGDPQHTTSSYNGDNQPATAAFLTAPIGLAFDATDDLYIADIGSYLVRRVDAQTKVITTVAGSAANAGTYCPDTTCGEGGPATSAFLASPYGVAVNAAGDIFISENGLSVVRKVAHDTGIITTVAGQRGVPCADMVCGGEGVVATNATLNAPTAINLDPNGGLIIADSSDEAIRGLTSDGKMFTLAGALSQSPGPSSAGSYTGAANGVQFNYPTEAVIDGSGQLIIADTNAYIWEVAKPPVLPTQTITFNQIPNATYGDPSFDLTRYATTDSGLAITFTCTGPATCSGTDGATLTITGVGTVTVTANQAGDSAHAPATPVTDTFTVAKAALTVKADNLSFTYKSAPQLPPLTYSFTGLVNGDSTSAISGTPVLATSATATSLVGQYPITVGVGSLTAANYTFTTASGTLTITGGVAQTITFNPLPNLTYGAGTFTLTATATSGDPVIYSVSGPAEILSNRLTVTGAGTVTVTANQAGDAQYGPATAVTQSFLVAPAALNITAQPATRAYGDANPAFTFVASGFVSADTAAVLSGAPAFSTTVVAASVPGSYPVTITQGTLFASNYTFTFVSSTLTVTKAAQTITFTGIRSQPFGPIQLNATASSGLPVEFSVPAPATITGNQLVVNKPGVVTVTASQPGNDLYLAATPVSQTIDLLKQNIDVTLATVYTIPFGGAIPDFGYSFGVGISLPANRYSGAPDITTTATSTSAPGQYPIVFAQGSLISDYYNFTFHNGTLTILQPSSFILTATPASVIIPSGQARQVTVTLTPVNDFVGTVTIGCGDLPTGVTCVSSPGTLTTTMGASGVSPVTATLTISAGAPVASAQINVRPNSISMAGWALFPALILGGLLGWQRKRFAHDQKVRQLFLLAIMILGASGLIACGSSNKSTSVQPGTTTIQVTGTGTSTSGPASATLALSVTIQ